MMCAETRLYVIIYSPSFVHYTKLKPALRQQTPLGLSVNTIHMFRLYSISLSLSHAYTTQPFSF